MVVVIFILIVFLVIWFSIHLLVTTVFVVFVRSAIYLCLRILFGVTNGKFLMGSRPAAPKRIWMFGLFGVIFGGRGIVILKVQGI